MSKKPYPYYRRGPRREYEGRAREGRPRRQERKYPMPLGDKCNPLCPFFICTRRALVVVNKPYRGKMVKVAVCRLTGEECIGAECRYASCRLNAMLQDGRCAKALERYRRRQYKSDEEMFREIESVEDYEELM